MASEAEPFLVVELDQSEPRVTGLTSCFLGHELPHKTAGKDGVFAEWNWDGQTVSVETDRYGMQPLYYYCGQSRFAVSPSIPALIEHGVPAGLDHEALSVFFHVGYFVGDDTPFRAIRAVPPNASLRWDRHSLRVHGQRPRVTASRLSREQALRRYVAVFREAVRRRPPTGNAMMLPLSGGRDSRHLAFELVHAGLPPLRCVTVDTGRPSPESDAAVASRVCHALALEHVVLTGPRLSVEHERRKNTLTNFCADEHAWLLPAADYLRRNAVSTIYDGIGGDVLSSGLFLTKERVDLFAREAFGELASDILNGTTITSLLPMELRNSEFSRDRAVKRVARELESQRDAANPMSAFFFWNRTRREVSLAPYRIFAGVPRVYSPYLDVEVFDLLMSLPASMMVDHRFHTDAIDLAFPQFSHVPYAAKSSGGSVNRQECREVALTLLIQCTDGSRLVCRRFLVPRLARALIDRSYAETMEWLAPDVIYLRQLEGMLRDPSATPEAPLLRS